MSIRVVARVRPLLSKELEKDVIVQVNTAADSGGPHNVVRIPNPKNEAEEFSFTFNGVYGQATSQEELFNAEVAPHVRALFQGLDITLFAYGVTGTGKTHTMRGGMKLADRGVIPRLLSHVFRRGKKMVKDADGLVDVDVALSYYEIYNDKVFDLLEPPEKRTPTGLPLREKDNRTHVVGLSEQKCVDLRDFEKLYIAANQNRVTASTKLNAHSSRSHAILRVKVTQTTRDAAQNVLSIRESTASAIDLAGSEDNRRTDNGRERLVESAAINKSLFVLSQCVDAIARGEKRIPYRESKMTRILSLGQNNGITVMILNLAPVRSYHLDTLSSLTVSSRAKRIEVREIENEVVFRQLPRSLASSAVSSATSSTTSLSSSTTMSSVSSAGNAPVRQPLRALTNNTHNIQTGNAAAKATAEKPAKLFTVYTDRKPASATTKAPQTLTATTPDLPNSSTTSSIPALSSSRKSLSTLPRMSLATSRLKSSSSSIAAKSRSKLARPSIQPYSALAFSRPSLALQSPATPSSTTPMFSAEQIEAIVERKVAEALAARAQEEQELQQKQRLAMFQQQQDNTLAFTTMFNASSTQGDLLSESVQKRLEALERRIEDNARASLGSGGDKSESDLRTEGLRYLLLARQHKEVGEDDLALHNYEQALHFFPGQAKLISKIDKLRARMARRRTPDSASPRKSHVCHHEPEQQRLQKRKRTAASNSRLAPSIPTTPSRRATKRKSDTSAPPRESMTDHEADADAEEEDEEATDASVIIAHNLPTSLSDKSPRRRKRASPDRKVARISSWLGPGSSGSGGNGEDADDESRCPAPLPGMAMALTPRKKKLLDIVNSRDVARICGLSGVSAYKARSLVDYLERGGGVAGCIVGEDNDEDLGSAAAPIHRIESLAQLRNVPGMGGETVERAYEGLMAI
ncbi:hypothetical protein SEPCBS119000_006515 [Sporothrix epigloea]|uniref:Kinesin motor domain-containing protein n=1 Tax=Sporothrix epigloea TaxID=1892477 RepID=A0ABP0E5C6_9PEZI